MDSNEIKQLVKKNLPDCKVMLTGDDSHFQIVVVSSAFIDKRPLDRHRLVYDLVNQAIVSGQLHALSVKTFTPEEWEAMNG